MPFISIIYDWCSFLPKFADSKRPIWRIGRGIWWTTQCSHTSWYSPGRTAVGLGLWRFDDSQRIGFRVRGLVKLHARRLERFGCHTLSGVAGAGCCAFSCPTNLSNWVRLSRSPKESLFLFRVCDRTVFFFPRRLRQRGEDADQFLNFVEVLSQILVHLIAANATPVTITIGIRTRPAVTAVFLFEVFVVIAKIEWILSC